MPAQQELLPQEWARLTAAFQRARRDWGPRARFAREAGVDASTVQVLEGQRHAPISDDMIERLTRVVGWTPGEWRHIAGGETPHQDMNPLRAAREARGWSPYRMAQELRVSAQQVERWEAGEDVPADRAALIQQLFGKGDILEAARRIITDESAAG